MLFDLPRLPYDRSALEPWISARALELHHGRHHRTYVTTLNRLIEGSALATIPLESIVRRTATDEAAADVFNNAAQAWNHTFFWNSMKPGGGGRPTGDLARRIDRDFGSAERFRQLFQQAAASVFGSGWAWLVADKVGLTIVKTANAMTPIAHGQTPLLVCDVWEHAYHLDYQNRRAEFVSTFLDRLVNWDFAARNLAGVTYSRSQLHGATRAQSWHASG